MEYSYVFQCLLVCEMRPPYPGFLWPWVGPSPAWHSPDREGQECAKTLARMGRSGGEEAKTQITKDSNVREGEGGLGDGCQRLGFTRG